MAGHGATIGDFDRITVNGLDGEGREIGQVYAKHTPRYAIYSTLERVQILYADDQAMQRAQRQRLAALACLRSEIDGALAPWRRASPRWRLNTAAQQYDGRIAAGLIEALEGNLDSGRRILQMVRAEIACERTSRAQLYYLLSTIGIALVVLLPCAAALAGVGEWPGVLGTAARAVWLAVTAGVIGTVYSIALSLRKRDVTNDRRWLDHLTDAGVRICIGAIAGFVVAEFLLTGALQLRLGGVALTDTSENILATTPNVSFVLIVGFIAGFAERFVPDLLNSYASERPAAPPAPAAPAPAPIVAAGGAAASTVAPVQPASPPTDQVSKPAGEEVPPDGDGDQTEPDPREPAVPAPPDDGVLPGRP